MSHIKQLGNFRVRVFKDKRFHWIQCTHNDYQWQSINLEKIEDLRILWQTLGNYLEEDDWIIKQKVDDNGNDNSSGDSSTD